MRKFTTGEFAKFCNVPKGTILFYDKIGLLKPNYTSENGYRRYGPEQYSIFMLISILKLAGCSLEEIKLHLNHMDGKDFLYFLKEKKTIIDQQIKHLQTRQCQLADMIACLAEALEIKYDNLEIIDMPKELLEIWETNASFDESEDAAMERFHNYNEYLDGKEFSSYPFGLILDINAAKSGKYLERAYFQSATENTPQNKILIKKAGSYAILNHFGSKDSHLEAIKMMLMQIKEIGLITDSEIFAYDLFGIIIEDGIEKYRVKYCIGIVQ